MAPSFLLFLEALATQAVVKGLIWRAWLPAMKLRLKQSGLLVQGQRHQKQILILFHHKRWELKYARKYDS